MRKDLFKPAILHEINGYLKKAIKNTTSEQFATKVIKAMLDFKNNEIISEKSIEVILFCISDLDEFYANRIREILTNHKNYGKN